MSTKMSLKDKLDGDELDLSMMSLTEVPVKEIASLPRATKIDLSNNQLTTLPSNFATSLGNITRLELGSNKIKEIPSNFNKLHHLKRLDLYNNQLTNLPLSFCELRSLKWLDLKGNPLNPTLRKVAGDCLNQKECEAAARNIVAHLKKLQTEMENEKQEKLRKAKEKEEARARAEEEKIAKKRAEKKAAKEKRKAEQRALQEAQKTQANGTATTEKQYTVVPKPATPARRQKKPKSGAWSLLAWLNVILLGCLLGVVGAGLFIYTNGDLTPSGITAALPKVVQNAQVLSEHTAEAFQLENLKQTTKTVGTVVASAAHDAWSTLQVYTGDLSIYTEPLAENVTYGWFWVTEQALLSYNWIVNDVDWESILQTVKSIAVFFYEQWLVICEELSRNEALMSVFAAIRTHTAGVVDYLGEIWGVVWEQISFIIEYIQEEGPGILATLKEHASGALHTAKQSIEGLVK